MNILKYWWLCVKFSRLSKEEIDLRFASAIEDSLDPYVPFDHQDYAPQREFLAWFEMRETRASSNAHMPYRHYVVWNWVYRDTPDGDHKQLVAGAQQVVDYNGPGRDVAMSYIAYYYRREQLREGRPWLFKLTGS
jgi:hypothetical protein